jgi:hypothetical protein
MFAKYAPRMQHDFDNLSLAEGFNRAGKSQLNSQPNFSNGS